MQSLIDQKQAAAAAAEGVYSNDLANVATIQTNIAAATSPLVAAQAQLATDQAAYVAALQDLDQAVQAEIAALTAPVAPPATS